MLIVLQEAWNSQSKRNLFKFYHIKGELLNSFMWHKQWTSLSDGLYPAVEKLVLFLYEMAFKNFIISIAFSQYIQSRNWTKFTYIFSHYAAFDTKKTKKTKKVKCSFFLNISNMTLFEICCCHTFLFLNVDEDYYKQDHSNYKWVILHMCFNIKCLKNYSIIFNFNKKGVSCSFKWWPVDLQVICSTLEHRSDLSTYP